LRPLTLQVSFIRMSWVQYKHIILCYSLLGMANIGPRSNGHLQNIPMMGKYTLALLGMGMSSSNYPQIWTGMGVGANTLMSTLPHAHTLYRLYQ